MAKYACHKYQCTISYPHEHKEDKGSTENLIESAREVETIEITQNAKGTWFASTVDGPWGSGRSAAGALKKLLACPFFGLACDSETVRINIVKYPSFNERKKKENGKVHD